MVLSRAYPFGCRPMRAFLPNVSRDAISADARR